MNCKITFPELVTLLAERSGLPKRQCEMFLKELFSTVSNTLIEGEGVKIKGLGTFKLTDIDPRKSIDVNTGREIEIPGHKRVSFTPSKSLADTINLPFAAFETVELNDAVTDDMLLAADSPAEDTPETGEAVAETVRNTAEEAAEEVIAEECTAADEETDDAADDVTVENIPTGADNAGNADIADDADDEQAEQADSIVAEIAAMETRWETTEREQQSPETEPNNNDLTANAKVVEIKHSEIIPKNSFFGWGFAAGILTCLCLAAIGFAIWYNNHDNTAAVDTGVSKAADTAAVAMAARPADKVTDTASAAAEAAEPAKAVKIEPEPPTESAGDKKNEVDTKPSDTPIYDTITRTRYLTTMAKEHYGSYHLWPYIYEANKSLGHPDRIRPGTKVKVPSLARLGIDPKDPAVISAAKRKGRQIYSRYEKK